MAAGCSRVGQWVLRGVLSGVFVFAAWPKMTDPSAFAVSLDAYGLLPASLVWAMAYYLPAVELLVALGLWRSRWRRAAAWLMLFMLLVFTGAVAHAWFSGLDISCGCFGEQFTGPLLGSLIRNVVLLGLVVGLLLGEYRTEPSCHLSKGGREDPVKPGEGGES